MAVKKRLVLAVLKTDRIGPLIRKASSIDVKQYFERLASV